MAQRHKRRKELASYEIDGFLESVDRFRNDIRRMMIDLEPSSGHYAALLELNSAVRACAVEVAGKRALPDLRSSYPGAA